MSYQSRHEPGILYLKPWVVAMEIFGGYIRKISYVSWRGTSDLRTGYIRCHYGRTDYFPGRFDSLGTVKFCNNVVIQKNHLSAKIELFRLLFNEGKGDFNGISNKFYGTY